MWRILVVAVFQKKATELVTMMNTLLSSVKEIRAPLPETGDGRQEALRALDRAVVHLRKVTDNGLNKGHQAVAWLNCFKADFVQESMTDDGTVKTASVVMGGKPGEFINETIKVVTESQDGDDQVEDDTEGQEGGQGCWHCQ